MKFSRFRFADSSAGTRRSNAVPGNKLAGYSVAFACTKWKMNFLDLMSHLEVVGQCQRNEWVRTQRASREQCF
jgi:hypothetical protein